MDSRKIVLLAAKACEDIKAVDIKILNISEVSSLADWILITEGLSDIQVKAIINNVEKTINQRTDLSPLRKEGINEAKWALLDYGDIIINVFQTEERKFYNLEGFWSNGVTQSFKSTEEI